MTYYRVIPRDLFNEGKLLNQLGFLSLAILDAKENTEYLELTQENDEAFDVLLSDTGSLFVSNINLYCKGEPIELCTTANSKLPYPLQFGYSDGENEFNEYVFGDDGEFSPEFVELIAYITD